MLRNPQHDYLLIKPVKFEDFFALAIVCGVSTSYLLIKTCRVFIFCN